MIILKFKQNVISLFFLNLLQIWNSASSTATAEAQPPSISLNGPATIAISQGQPYDFCTPSSSFSSPCDRGATANDAVDGRLDSSIRFCGFSSSLDPAKAGLVAIPPISVACNINTKVPGKYEVAFSVTNSARMTASVTRTLVVTAACSVGEYLCADKVGGTTPLLVEPLLTLTRQANDDLIPAHDLMPEPYADNVLSGGSLPVRAIKLFK